MDGSTRRKRQLPRSRSGCLECRHHHRKCDERSPVCTLCEKYGRNCQYGTRIKWGGRPFRKSTFGKCMTSTNHQPASVVKVQAEHFGSHDESRSPFPFVYVVTTSLESNPVTAAPTETCPPSLEAAVYGSENEAERQASSQSIMMRKGRIATLSIAAPPSWLPDLPPTYKSLLNYFMHVVGSFCCDETVKTDFYRTFLPMGTATSHVLASMLNLAAVHRAKAGLAQDSRQLALLQVVAVEQLRPTLSGPPTEPAMATILMLCLSGVVSGGETLYSWRFHLEGAISLFINDPLSWTIHSRNSSKAFIARCFVSLMALANVSGSPPTDSVSRYAVQMLGEKNEAGYIDEFTAFSVDLVYVLFEVGALVREKDRVPKIAGITDAGLNERSLGLIEQLQTAMDTGYAKPKYGKLSTLTPARKQQYLNINEAYHQATILQIHQRIRGLASSAIEIQRLVRRILALLADVELHQGPCLGVVLLFPLFSAGCGAVESAHRQQVRGMLKAMVELYGLSNVQHGMKLLEVLWTHRDEHVESEENISWDAFIDKNFDLILY